MALNTQVSSSFTAHILSYLERVFLKRYESTLYLSKYGLKRSLAARSGNTITWNIYANPTALTTALVAGVTPNGQTATSSSTVLTLAQYGGFECLADEFILKSITDEAEEVTGRMGYQAALTQDRLCFNELSENGTQRYADDASNSSRADVQTGQDKLTSLELKTVLMAFRNGDVPPFMDGFYKGVIHPRMEFDLISDTSTNPYYALAANTTNVVQETGHIGRAYGINLFTSTNIQADTTSTNVYGNIFCGMDAYATGDIQTAGLEMIHKPRGSGGSEDPLNQRETWGWKMWFAAKVLRTVGVQVVWAYNAS